MRDYFLLSLLGGKYGLALPGVESLFEKRMEVLQHDICEMAVEDSRMQSCTTSCFNFKEQDDL